MFRKSIAVPLLVFILSSLLLMAGWCLQLKFGEIFFARSGALLVVLVLSLYLLERFFLKRSAVDFELLNSLPKGPNDGGFLGKWQELAKEQGYEVSDVTEEIFYELYEVYLGRPWSADGNNKEREAISSAINDRKKTLENISRIEVFLAVIGTFIWGFGDLIFRFFVSNHIAQNSLPF